MKKLGTTECLVSDHLHEAGNVSSSSRGQTKEVAGKKRHIALSGDNCLAITGSLHLEPKPTPGRGD